MSLKNALKKLLGINRSSTIINSNQQQLTAINRNQQQLTETESYNIRDLQYARRMGQIEQMAADLALIKEKITSLDIKFDLRVPDVVLTEKKFDKEIGSNEDFYKELEAIRQNIEILKEIISNQQQLTAINRNQQQLTAINRNQQMKILDDIKRSAEFLEDNLRQKEVLKHLDDKKLSSEEIGNLLGISRSRANQILLELEKKGLVYRIKYGKKILWGKVETRTARSR
ncbi:MAG: hypothetical protein QXO84_02215 [Candidatus Aenigmatarchaeota archaeon]